MRLRRKFRLTPRKASLNKGIAVVAAISGIWILAIAIPSWVWLTLLALALLWVATAAWDWKGQL